MELLHRYLAANKQELPPITGRDVWQVSRSFPTMTVAPDGWHPRTFSLLGETGRELLARQLMIWEAAGMWPHSNSTIHMSSQRKPAGGRRLIGWYRAAFRLWSAIRGEHWREWEMKHATESFFGAAKRNSVLDVGWRQGVRAEFSQAKGTSTAIVAQDLRKCYELIRFVILVEQGIKHFFLLLMLRTTVLSYGWKRHIVIGACISMPIQAWRGMVVGCIAATRELKAYLKDALLEVTLRHPRVYLDTRDGRPKH